MLYVRLQRLNSNNDKVRTKKINGHTDHFPEPGSLFYMQAKSLDLASQGAFREILTSVIISVETIENKSILFKTQNSSYLLTVLSEDEKEFEYVGDVGLRYLEFQAANNVHMGS